MSRFSAYTKAHAALWPLIWCFTEVTADAQVDFNRQVRPILAEHCFQCHGPDGEKRSDELRLDVEAEARKSAIVAGSPDDSALMHRILSRDPDAVMPPPATGKVLTESQKEVLRQWIQEGAKYSSHWAFQPIAKSDDLLESLPPVHEVTLPVDRFLMQKLEQAGLTYSNPVSRAQFIRRATFDLIGLPPTWVEVEAFEKDTEAGAEERLIERLMASPRYGERWGRHWLDIARYADTHGGAAIGFTSFPFSYTYRDYVINAFNKDLPIDRFLQEQIAADQLGLPDGDPALAALGFLTVGMQFRNYHDTIDDQIDVVTRGLMGLTVTCARCHDHKFDPIPTADYYALYAAIAPSKAPPDLPAIGSVADEQARQQYERELADLKMKAQQFAREQNEVLRNRLRMQVGLYLAEIAKGIGEQDLSTQFLSYRTDDIRPLVFNRWRTWLAGLTKEDPVFGPWLEMQSWGSIAETEFLQKRDEYLGRLSAELDAIGRTPDKLHALRGEPPKWNPFVVDALVEQKPNSLSAVATVYGKVFSEQQRLWLQALLESSAEAAVGAAVLPDDHPQHQVINSPSHRQIRHHLYAEGSPFDLSDEEAIRLTNRTIADLASSKKGAIHQLNLSSPGSPPRAMIVREDPNPKPTNIFLRGNPLARGEVVEARFLTALPGDHSRTYEPGQRRLGLAQSLVADSNPLTARVLVNWAWQNHFGTGLVRTPDDFGTRGQAPTHPELLDYLADQLRKNGWSLKWLHRQIMQSQAYRQGAVENEHSRQVDPENLLLWRMPRRRLEFEAMRDAMLAASEELDLTIGGRPIDLNASPAVPRRSVYGFVNRDVIANLMSTFDTANPNACTARRPETTVPQQTLFALNSDFIQDRAARVALLTKDVKLASDDERIRVMVRRILCRNPTESEIAQAKAFMTEATASSTTENGVVKDPERSWVLLAHALLASNEFTFLD
ncbi:MAG: PSD1 and planctomycete cytochrome C domain-containing protein [Planctomycetaceae bacterium]